MADINLGVGGANSAVAGGYDIENSVKTEADNSEWMQRATGGGNDSNLKQHSISAWVKRTELGGTQMILSMANIGRVRFDSSNKLQYQFKSSGGGALTTTRVFRDTSAWLHIFVVADSTLSTANDRLKIYVNGVRETVFDYNVAPTQNSDSNGWGLYNSYNLNFAGKSDDFYNGYIAETFFIGEQSLLPTDFGEFDDDSGIWKPKEYTGTFGSNDTYLDFADASNLGNNAAGGADLSLNNITSADQAVDSPTNNFAILSQSMQGYYEDLWSVISDGGTKFRCTEFDSWITTVSSIGVTKGKWYAEFQPTGARPNNMYGIASMEQLDNNSGYIYGGHLGEANESWGIGYYQPNGNLYKQQNSGYTLTSSFGSSISQNQKVGVAIDMDNHNLYIAINNTWQNSGDPTSGATGTGAISFDATETVAFGLSGYSLGSGNDTIVSVNFGGYRTGGLPSINSTDANGYGVFRYAPPSGYYALCTKNLAEYG